MVNRTVGKPMIYLSESKAANNRPMCDPTQSQDHSRLSLPMFFEL